MYLMTATRNGVSAKELERQLGVTYKCAWRIGHQLRLLMAARAKAENPGQLSGHVEVDETFVGGKAWNKHQGKGGRGDAYPFGLRSKVRPPMTRQEEIAAVSAEKSLSADRVKELRSIGMDSIRGEFILRLLRGRTPVDTLSIYWERAPEFISTAQVEDVVRKLVFGRRHRVTGEFMDLWLLCYPDDDEIKQSVEREIDRMVGAVAALVAQRSH